MHTCPNCGKKTIKNITKACIGPGGEIKCKECEAIITIPGKSMWLMAIYLIMIILLRVFFGGIGFYLFAAIGFVLFTWIHIKYAPLIKK